MVLERFRNRARPSSARPFCPQLAKNSYPRYKHLRESFRQDFDEFRKVFDDEGWGALEPNQSEVTYVNLIPAGEGWQEHGQLEKVCTLFNLHYTGEDRGLPEEVSVGGKYVLKDEDGAPVGRLNFAANPVVHVSDNHPAIRLTLTARGAPIGEQIDGVLRFLDHGHAAIVRTFTSITTKEMHKIWKRTR